MSDFYRCILVILYTGIVLHSCHIFSVTFVISSISTLYQYQYIVSLRHEQQRPRSACASAQSGLDLHYPLPESLANTDCKKGEQRAGWYFTHAQDELNLRILRMFEVTFSRHSQVISV